MSKQELTQCEKQVLVGKQAQAKLRLVFQIVPEQDYQERIRKINKKKSLLVR